MNAEQLKNSILQRAIEGKLVEQREEEGTAAELLREIKAEKARLVKEGKLKKEKPLPAIKAEEIPFEIPESWEWVRWGDLSQSIQYGYNAPAKEHGRIKMVRISDIQDNKILWGTVPYCDIDESDIKTYLLEKNDILFARTGGTVGKSYLVNDTPEEAVYAGYLIRTRYSSRLMPRYLKSFMESQLYWTQLRGGTIATAQPNCNGKTLAKMILPLPPLAEQKRIVAKIEELLPHVEQYGKAHDELTALNEKFPDAMKKSVLQYAMEGKLVEQREEEGTAKELLAAIKAEKARLVKEGKLKKEKPLPEIKAEEIPFEIPESWEWVRLGEISINKDSERIPLSVAQREKLAKIYDYYGASGVIDKVDKYIFDKPLLLIGEDGANLLMRSKPIAFIAEGQYWVNNHAHVLDFYSGIFMKYVMYYINGINLAPYVTGTAQPKMNQAKMNSIGVPLPPLAEQKRIVAKIEELLACCGALEK